MKTPPSPPDLGQDRNIVRRVSFPPGLAPVRREPAGTGTSGDGTLLPFDERAVFIAGPARSGTTLLTALLDGHPDLLVLPEETAYFATVLTKLGGRSRREQFDYLTTDTLANVLFGGPCKWGRRFYPAGFTRRLHARFAGLVFDPAHRSRDLLALLMEALCQTLNRPLASVARWVEKTPANRDYLDLIYQRFPHARILLTLRDPRALLASHVQLERTRQRRRFSAYLVVRHWLSVARLVARHRNCPDPARPLEIVEYGRLLADVGSTMRRVSGFLDLETHPALLTPTKLGVPWRGNSASQGGFDAVNPEPEDRWRKLLTPSEIGWIEWHCRAWMEALGYEPVSSRRKLRHWLTPLSPETPREYLKSRFYSVFGKPAPRNPALPPSPLLSPARR